jgi:hypothetical protein
MSPTLFNICIDDLLEELQTACLEDGIAMNDALDRLVAMAYADDPAVSSAHVLDCSA